MNYRKIYDSLIDRARNREIHKPYESHHIIPRCMGGLNDPTNLVNLTAEEHYVAHQLLVKIFPDNLKIVRAAIMMSLNTQGLRPNNKLYGWLRRQRAELMKGQPGPNKDISLKQETKDKISQSLKGNIPWNKGIKTGSNPEHSKRMKGRTPWNKGLKTPGKGGVKKGNTPWNKGQSSSPVTKTPTVSL